MASGSVKEWAAAAALAMCWSCGRSAAIVVGSKNFTEQIVLGEIAAQQIENQMHVPVERRLDLGGTLLAQLALKDGQIDLYPEYTGTALTTVLKRPLATDAGAVFGTVAAEYERRFHLRWLPPLGFNDSFAMAVRSTDAEKLKSRTLSAASERTWRLGIGYEFLTRPDGLARLDAIYHFRWTGLPRTMDLGLLYRALSGHQVDMAAANSTDGLLTLKEYAVLEDDKHAFPPYQACLIVRDETLQKEPRLAGTLGALSNTINEETMRELNKRVDVEHVPVVRVAADFLKSLGQAARSGAQ